MYIGKLNVLDHAFLHKGTNVPYPPSKSENNAHTWVWNDAYDAPIDVHYTLEKGSFIGAVALTLTEDAVSAVEVLVNGQLSGAHRAQSGSLTGGTIQIPVGIMGEDVTLRLYPSLKDLTLSDVELLGAAEDGDPFVYPTPKSIEFLGRYSKIKDVVSKNGNADELFAVSFFKERLKETLGTWQSERGVTVVFDLQDTDAFRDERYTVTPSRGKITVTAGARLPLLYGADTLLQVTSARGVRICRCDDRPAKPFRGFHVMLPAHDQLDFMQRLMRYVLLPLRYNTLIVEITASMRYHSHPEINEAWEGAIAAWRRGELPQPPHIQSGDTLSHEEVACIAEYAHALGFDVIPEVQSLGHVQYITWAHPEIAEIEEESVEVTDTRTEDARPASVYRHCYCPSLEESYRIIFDLIDEIVDVVKPRKYVHIGHDEVYQIGVCPRCRGKDPASLFATHVTRLHDYIAKKGLRTVMWADMLQPPTVRPYKTYPAIDLLPRDILMLDFVWYFKPSLDIEDNLLCKGYSVAVGNLYSSHYPRYRSRISKEGMLGGQISMWTNTQEELLGAIGKLWDTAYLSEMLWNAEDYDERNRRTYTALISQHVQPKLRDLIRGMHNPKGYRAVKLPLPRGRRVPDAVRALRPQAILPSDEKIPVNTCCDRLVFEHATLFPSPIVAWRGGAEVGCYTVHYTDGTHLTVPVRYAENVLRYDVAYGEAMPQEYYRHTGYVGTWFADPVASAKAPDGSDVTLYGFVWENPYPTREIASISYAPHDGDYCGLILAGIHALNKK